MSIASESTSYEQALTLVGEMPFADKLRFNAELATLLRKEGKSGAVGKAAKKEKKAKDPDAPKRAAAPGTLAWIAFVKHCKDTMSERFSDCTLEKERLAVAKAIKAEDKDAYDAFVAKYKEEHSAAPSEDEGETETAATPALKPAAPPAAPLTAAQKLEKLKAAAAEKKAAPAEKPKAAEKPKKEVKKAAAKPKKEEKKAAPAEEPPMPKKTIEGTDYWFDPDTNGLYSIVDGGFGAWVGYFQPDNEEEPIRHTESPADE
jgi:hypothetical protein